MTNPTPAEIIDKALEVVCSSINTVHGVLWSDRLKMREAQIEALDAAGYAIENVRLASLETGDK